MVGADVELALMTHGVQQRQALLSRCPKFSLRKRSSTEKNHCQKRGRSGSIHPHAGTVDMELRSGVEFFHARGAMEWHGQLKPHNHDPRPHRIGHLRRGLDRD